MPDDVYIIAEIGVNHAGDLNLAQKMIAAAAASGADAVKFQTFRAEDILGPWSPDFQELKSGEMGRAEHRKLFDLARTAGVEFLSTPFSPRGVDLLEETGVSRYKIASMDLDNRELLAAVAETGKPMLLSTGMATLAEIAASVEFLHLKNVSDLTLLHCIANYPSRAHELNLSVIERLGSVFGLPVGYSDHFPGHRACLAAYLAGARVLETHFTTDKTLPGGDHDHSADPWDLENLVAEIELHRTMMGRAVDLTQRPDRANADQFRRGVYAARSLAAGSVLAREHLAVHRPPTDIHVNQIPLLLGRTLRRDLAAGEALGWADV